MAVVPFEAAHVGPFMKFVSELSEEDLTFIKEPLTDVSNVAAWLNLDSAAGRRWLVIEHDSVVGYLAVLRLPGWSRHVGEIRLVIHPAHRGHGLGRNLARKALIYAVESGAAKLVVELVADDEAHIAMFTAIGFIGEALLTDHVRDRQGRSWDLIMLAHYVNAVSDDMEAAGLTEELRHDAI